VRRRLFNLAAAVSLVLCIATALLWMRSYFAGDHVTWTRLTANGNDARRSTISLLSGAGGFAISTHDQDYPGIVLHPHDFPRMQRAARAQRFIRGSVSPPWGYALQSAAAADDAFWRDGFWRRIGFARTQDTAYLAVNRTFFVPAWFLVLAFAALPAWRAMGLWRERRARRAGHCPTCGYDCRATPRKCPECGTDLPPSKAATDDQHGPCPSS
jgi:hypothetical protein